MEWLFPGDTLKHKGNQTLGNTFQFFFPPNGFWIVDCEISLEGGGQHLLNVTEWNLVEDKVQW